MRDFPAARRTQDGRWTHDLRFSYVLYSGRSRLALPVPTVLPSVVMATLNKMDHSGNRGVEDDAVDRAWDWAFDILEYLARYRSLS